MNACHVKCASTTTALLRALKGNDIMTMNISSQPIDQPTLPTLPPAAGANPSAELGPATSAVEIISQETPSNSCELDSIEPSLTDAEKETAVSEFQKLDAWVDDKPDELMDEFQDLMHRFS
jgi:hypothetical protein